MAVFNGSTLLAQSRPRTITSTSSQPVALPSTVAATNVTKVSVVISN